MVPFKPAEDYKGLLKQANALYRLVVSNEEKIENLKISFQRDLRRIFTAHKEELESERQMNHELTLELEELIETNK